MTQDIANLCVNCEVRFHEWTTYHAHVTGNKCHKKIVPIRTTTRTFKEIVADVEKTWGKALIF